MLHPPHTCYNRLHVYYFDRAALPLFSDPDLIGTWNAELNNCENSVAAQQVQMLQRGNAEPWRSWLLQFGRTERSG